MGWKCSVAGCRSGYPEDTSGASFYRYPSNEEERSYWINKLPNKDFVYTEGKRICSKHWPSDAKMIKVKGRLKPGCPPTKFEDVPQHGLLKKRTVNSPNRTPNNVTADFSNLANSQSI